MAGRRELLAGLVAPTSDDSGFSLVELMVVIVIFGVVGAVTVAGVVQGMETTTDSRARADAQQEVRTVVERVSRELRAAERLFDVQPSRVDLEVVRGDRRTRFVYEVDDAGALIQHRTDLARDDEEEFDRQDDPDRSSTLMTDVVEAELFEPMGLEGGALDLDDGDDLEDVRRIGMTVVRAVPTVQDGEVRVETMVWPRNTKTVEGDF